MPAIVVATRSALEMIGCGENRVTVFIEIKVLLIGMRGAVSPNFADFSEDGFGIVERAGNPRDRFETRATEARRLRAIRRQAAEHVMGNDDFVTPTRPFIKMRLCRTAPVVVPAQGTFFIAPQAIVPAEK